MDFILFILIVLVGAWVIYRFAPYRTQTKFVDPDTLMYFCVKYSDNYTSIWPKDKQLGECFEFGIAGITFRKGIDDYIGEGKGFLLPENDNPYDPNAIKILAEDGHHLGYVPKDSNMRVRKSVKLPVECYYIILKEYDNDRAYYHTDCYINLN